MILKFLSAVAAVIGLTAQQSAAQCTLSLPDRAVTVEYSNGGTVFKGAPVYGNPGQPSLPGYKVSFVLPEGIDPAQVSVSIENPVEEIVQGNFDVKPALPPSIGDEVIWPANKNILNGMDMDVYGKDAFFPADFKGKVTFGKMRQYQLVDIIINPFKYNPVTHQLKKITGGTLTVTYPQEAAAAKKSTSSSASIIKKADGKVEKILRKSVVNPDAIDSYSVQTQSISAKSSTTLAATQAESASGEGYAIITTNAIVSASTQLQNLITQKRNAGYNVILATENTWGGGVGDVAAERIRLWLQQNVETQNLYYVLLVGNPDPATGDVPMKMCWPRLGLGSHEEAPTDFYYAELSGNWDLNGNGSYGEDGQDFGPIGGADVNAEVVVGRIPYYGSVADLDKILAKSITYANATSRGWRKSVLLPMVPTDIDNIHFALSEEMRDTYLSPNGWKSFRLYCTFDPYSNRYCDKMFEITPAIEHAPCTPENVEDAWKKNPFGLVVWATHGTATSAVKIISSSQAANLNDNYPSMVFQSSCDNAYPENSNNLAYSLLLNGAVSTVGATRGSIFYAGQNSGFLNTGSDDGMGYTYGLHVTSGAKSTGDALNAVKSDGEVEWMNWLVFNVYGCPDLALNIDTWTPTECKARATSPTSIELTWTDNSYETGFRIERATGSGSFSEIATVESNFISYTNSGLSPNTRYRYRVRAYYQHGTSDYSNIDSTSTFSNIAPGKAVTASSQQSGNGATNAIDNNATSTRWAASSGTMPQWYQIDLGADLDLSGCEVVFERTGTTGDCNDFIISTSSDNTNWTEQYNRSNNTNTAQTQNCPFQATARYVRITISDAPGTYYASMYEFRVLGQTVPSNPIMNQPTSVPEDQLLLSWQPAVGATSYTVYQSQLGQPRFVIASGLTTTSFATTGLYGGKFYIFSVVAYNAAGHSVDAPYVSEVWTNAQITAPIAPSDLSIGQNDDMNGYSLYWNNKATNADGFEIERSVMGTSSWSTIGTVSYWQTNFNDPINNTTAYEYRVRAYNAGGYSAYSNIVNNLGIPNFNTFSYDGVSTISLAWGYSGPTPTGFKLERSDGNGYQLIATLGQFDRNYTNTGITNDHIYSYQIFAYNSYGTSYSSSITLASTPNAPGNLTANISGTTDVILNWADNSNINDGFMVEQAIGNGEFTQISSDRSDIPTYTVSGLTPSTTYRFRVQAYNYSTWSGELKSAYSNIVTIPIPTPIPAAPTNLSATAASSSQINLSWTDNSSNESGFYIERGTASAGPFSQIASVGANVNTYSNTGLTASTSYWYKVRAYNANGNSGYSNMATATTSAATLAAPANLVATINSRSQITLSWTDNTSNESGFYIERAPSGGSFTQVASVGANVVSYVNTGLATGTAYQYRIRAYNGSGNSAYSSTVTATTHSNLSLSGTASAQSEQSGNLTANAKDNSTTTRWCASSATMSQWWKIDLGSSKTLSEVEIMFEKTGTTGDCNDFKVETSTDNTNWTSRVDRTTNTNTAQTQAYTFSATARYVRITINDAPGTNWASMYEFRVFGK